MHRDARGGLASHEPVHLASLEGRVGRADSADGDDGHVAIGLEPGVLQQRAQREVRAAARARHPEPAALEILHFLRGMVGAQHDVERVPVLQGHEVLRAEALLGEDQRPLHHGAARVDRASHHGRGDLGPALEIHELRRDAFALEVAELLRDVEGQEDEGRRRADLDRLLRLGAVRRDEQGSKQRDRESHGKASGAGSG